MCQYYLEKMMQYEINTPKSYIYLISNDNVRFIIKNNKLFISEMLKNLINEDQFNSIDALNIKNELLSKTCLCQDVCLIICKYYEIQSIEVNVHSEYLSLIINYMEHQNGISGEIPDSPIFSKYMKDLIEDQWIVNFVEDLTPDLKEDDSGNPKYMSYSYDEKKKIPESRKFLFQLTETCHNLQINCLTHILCSKIATMSKGYNDIERRKILHGIHDE